MPEHLSYLLTSRERENLLGAITPISPKGAEPEERCITYLRAVVRKVNVKLPALAMLRGKAPLLVDEAAVVRLIEEGLYPEPINPNWSVPASVWDF